MSEKPPKNSTENIESRESAEGPPRYRTIAIEVLVPRKEGTEFIRVLECNGLHHRRCMEKASYNDKNEVIFADQLSREELGPCDGTHA